jgi:predicted nucleic acid-binding protein
VGIILDTRVLIEAERGRLNVEELVRGREDAPFGLSVITVSELLHAVLRRTPASGD